MTIGGNRLVLFLSFCRVNDLDTALNHIFPLPTGDIFSNRMVWFEDKQISAELVQMRLLSPELWGTPLPLAKRADPVINAEHDGRIWRRIPEPLRLLDDTAGVHHDDHQRYRANYSFCALIFFPLGYLARHSLRRISDTTRLLFAKPRYVKPAGTLRRATKVKADKNDSAYSNSFNAFSALAILARSFRLELLFSGQVWPAVGRLSEFSSFTESGIHGVSAHANTKISPSPVAPLDCHSRRLRAVLA